MHCQRHYRVEQAFQDLNGLQSDRGRVEINGAQYLNQHAVQVAQAQDGSRLEHVLGVLRIQDNGLSDQIFSGACQYFKRVLQR